MRTEVTIKFTIDHDHREQAAILITRLESRFDEVCGETDIVPTWNEGWRAETQESRF